MEKTNISTATIIRTIVLIIALINQVLTTTGHTVLPISDDQVAEAITLAFTIGSALVAWWKNNSFTKNAIKADNVLKGLKEAE